MEPLCVTATEAVKLVESGERVFIHGSAATPLVLVNAIFARAGEINNVELVRISTYGVIKWDEPKIKESFF